MRAYNHVIELAVEECKSTANPVKILKRITFLLSIRVVPPSDRSLFRER